MQDIKYQLKLDMYEFCTPELQKKLLDTRNKFKEAEEKKSVCAICVCVCESGKMVIVNKNNNNNNSNNDNKESGIKHVRYFQRSKYNF